MKKRNIKSFLALGLAFALTASSITVGSTEADAASKKKVKSVTLKISKKKVNKKTYKLVKGKKATIKVTVTPAKAKKKVTFKSSKKSVATVTKKGKVTAKKVGTAKITVTVSGKDKKKKTAWVKIKVTKKTTTTSSKATATPAPTAVPTAAPTATPKPVSLKVNASNEINPILDVADDGSITYGGDPSILVDGDTVYLYVGHDISIDDKYSITEYLCYSSKDLKDWTNHGSVLKMTDTEWGNPTQAWAGQVMKYNDKYYMYWCTQGPKNVPAGNSYAIGVAVSDSPTGPFTDSGKPIVLASDTPNLTTGADDDHLDIDPTAWIEKDAKGVEHRYLAWGNGRAFVCELKEDMTTISGKIVEMKSSAGNLSFREAPWIYRRQDESGNYYGDYYLFYAYGWREQMAYATTDNLMGGNLTFGSILMEPSATSNTNHMAVFDFKGKTYFVYHNGSLPGGSGFRRVPCITEVHFNDDGSIQPIPETAAGINGTTTAIYSCTSNEISHEHYINSIGDADYPYKKVKLGLFDDAEAADSQWVLSAGKADRKNANYVSIQSENKPGLYITANSDKTVTLAQNYELNTAHDKTIMDNAYKTQTFKTVEGLADPSGVSFESVSQPGLYITLINGNLSLTDGSQKPNATFYVGQKPATNVATGNPELSSVTASGYEVKNDGTNYSMTVPYNTKSVNVSLAAKDATTTILINGATRSNLNNISLSLSSAETTTFKIRTYASDQLASKAYTLTITKDYTDYKFEANVIKAFAFENQTDGAVAVDKADVPTESKSASIKYSTGVNGGKAITLNGSFGLKLYDKASELGDSYTISFWMKPKTLGGALDPTLTAGTFSPEYWLNLTFDAKIWSRAGDYYATSAANCFKANEWQHVAITVDSSITGNSASAVTGKLYVDGKPVASGDVAKGIMTNTNAAIYFGLNAWDAIYSGDLDDVLLIQGALDDRSISEIASGNVKAADYIN